MSTKIISDYKSGQPNVIPQLTHKYNVGAGLKFDGVNNIVNTTLSTYLSQFTVFVILKNNGNTTNNGVLAKQSSTLNRNFSIETTGVSNVFLGGFINGVVDNRVSFGFLNTTDIFCLTLTCSNTNLAAYLNKTLVDSIVTTGLPANTGSLTISNLQYVAPFNGIIYDVKIFNKALNQVEIDYLNDTKGNLIPDTAKSNLVANYTFNQKSGNTLIDEHAGLNGTLVNFTNTTPSVGNAWIDDLGNSILL